eukprot:PhF_6_TR15574/c0_g1_i1/m.24184
MSSSSSLLDSQQLVLEEHTGRRETYTAEYSERCAIIAELNTLISTTQLLLLEVSVRTTNVNYEDATRRVMYQTYVKDKFQHVLFVGSTSEFNKRQEIEKEESTDWMWIVAHTFYCGEQQDPNTDNISYENEQQQQPASPKSPSPIITGHSVIHAQIFLEPHVRLTG